MRQVTKEEYIEFLNTYDDKLSKDYSGLHMPPALMYWDNKIEKCVAKTYKDLEPGTYKELDQLYFIHKRVNEE